MTVNLSSVSNGSYVPLSVPTNTVAVSGPTPKPVDATKEAAIQVVTTAPVEIPVPPQKTVDFSAEVKAQEQALQQALEELNQQAAQSKISVGFNLDKASGLRYVQVTNSHTGDVVMQFPTNKMLDVAASIEQLKGMLYNKKA